MEIEKVFTVATANDYRYGRTYRIVRLSADKFGNQIAICEWIEETGYKSSHIFYAGDF